MAEATPDPSLVEDLIAAFLERRLGGEDCLEELCVGNPGCAAGLREGVEELAAMGLLELEATCDGELGTGATDGGASDDSDRPEMIGPYPVHGELGRGGLGVVSLARDPRLGRWIAIKRLPGWLARSPEARVRFEEEARFLAALDHPNIGAIHSLEEDSHGPYITLAMIPGETLADRIDAGPLAVGEALPVLRQIALALEAAHEASIVHRDLKPANVMLDRSGRVRVLDFGLATAVDGAPGEERRADGDDDGDTDGKSESSGKHLVGTPGYMSPEQVRGDSVDPRSDIYAWGCLAFECLTGEAAIAGKSVAARLDGTLAAAIDFTRLPAGLAPSVVSLVERSLALHPDDRPRTIEEVRRALDEAIARRPRRGAGDDRLRVGRLPEPWTRFIGRGERVTEAVETLRRVRLLTLVGPGGTGKTRLAIEVAREIGAAADAALGDVAPTDGSPSPGSSGPWWADLSSLTDPELVATTVAHAVAAPAAAGRDPLSSLIASLGTRPGLLVVDNCEHLLEPANRVVAALLEGCPELRVLATSRESLGVTGETILRVPPLTLPEPDAARHGLETLRRHESVRLFEERATAARPDWRLHESDAAAVIEICRRLDGLPLAIELAAARLATLSIAELSSRLAERLGWLRGKDASRQPRQRTLQALVDWSHDLLDPEAATLYRRLSVFSGGATLPSIEAVCGDDALRSWAILDAVDALVDKSLLERDGEFGEGGEGAVRFRMLETLREHAEDRLERSGEIEVLWTRHAEHFGELVDSLAPSLEGAGQTEGLARLEADRDNLRVAILRSADRTPELGARILGGAWRFYSVRGHWLEGRRLTDAILASDHLAAAGPERARVLPVGGLLAMQQGDYGDAERLLTESREIGRTLEDRGPLASAVHSLAQLELRRGRYPSARDHFEEHLSLSRELGEENAVAMTLAMLGNVAQLQGDKRAARPYFEESLEMSERLGHRYLTAGTLHNLADILAKEGETARAKGYWERALELNQELGNRPWEARNRMSLGLAAKLEGDYAAARRHYGDALEIHRALGEKEGLRDGLLFFGMLAAALGQSRRAGRLLGAAEAFTEGHGLSIARGFSLRVETARRELEETLGGEKFREAWRSGLGLSIEEALDLALDE